MKNIITKIAVLLSLVMVALCTAGLGSNTVDTKAATNHYAEKFDIKDYITTAPRATDSEHKDWLFAGWYKDADCKDYITDKNSATGEMYAKFVPADVLSVKCQNPKNTTVESDLTSLRLITTVDSLIYREVGFELVVGDQTAETKITTVYKKIAVNKGEDRFDYEPSIFSNSSEYFATVTLTSIDNKDFKKGMMIKPYWITMDGTRVEGVGRYARIEDSWENIVNIPVRLCTDIKVAGGKIVVNYDKAKFTYAGSETGDIGTIFDEMYVADNGSGSVTCVGNTSTVENVLADGMMLNLRFKKINAEVNEDATFSINNEEFANASEQLVYTDASKKEFDVADVTYKCVK